MMPEKNYYFTSHFNIVKYQFAYFTLNLEFSVRPCNLYQLLVYVVLIITTINTIQQIIQFSDWPIISVSISHSEVDEWTGDEC
jgi:hypothetical protein